ncbi:MAG: hypothetical protein P1U56_25325 [Saprospiraceae bacterium]|nr:hypothetical protein [Saprospiraceae bacterium]
MDPINHNHALLLDIISIQEYVFSSNKLKENIGASHIIEHELFKTALEKINVNYKKVYIGGGSALFTFAEKPLLYDFLKSFSSTVLTHFPGIQLAAAHINNYSDKEFKLSRTQLSQKMINQKSLTPSFIHLPKEGIFADCPQSNQYQEEKYADLGFISHSSSVKFEACKRAQKKRNREIDSSNFVFTDEIENFGQEVDKGYIAIVHIDGNNIGQQFINCDSEQEIADLSKQVKSFATDSMDDLIAEICTLFETKTIGDEFVLPKDKSGKNILPIRPILTGGDDVTFVCEGRLGIFLAERFIEIFEQKANQGPNEKSITACAGVAIVKSKFPFFKAYKLSEELCHEAKKASRSGNHSWISFHIANSGVSGDLKAIRKAELKTMDRSLTMNPYCLDSNHPNSIQTLKNRVHHFTREGWPISKIMELRDVVLTSESSLKLFALEQKYRNRTLDVNSIWKNDKTNIWDAIQLMQFYPINLLKQEVNG